MITENNETSNQKLIAVGSAVLITAVVTIVLTSFSIRILEDYGLVLFTLVPIGMGILSSAIYGSFEQRTKKESLK